MIQFLDPSVAALIAAGEVIHGPRDVLKELIENSLDAQAKNIHIDLSYGGIESISIRDDGIGLNEADLQLSIQKYATSKIVRISDLENLDTFGFRGEGLFSICTVSNLTIRTRQANSDIGFELVSVLPDKTPRVHPCGALRFGTEVICANLFAPIPVRRKLLKNTHLETKRVCDRVRALLVMQEDVNIELKNNGKVLMRLSAVKTTHFLDRLMQAYPQTKAKSWIYQEQIFDSGVIRAWYYPDNTKGLDQTWVVNKRWVAQSVFLKAAQRFVQQGILIVSIDLFSRDIDVNVHPQKHQIGFFKEDAILHTIVDFFQSFLGAYCAQDYGIDHLYQGAVSSGIVRDFARNESDSVGGEGACLTQTEPLFRDLQMKNFAHLPSFEHKISAYGALRVIRIDEETLICSDHEQRAFLLDFSRLKKAYDVLGNACESPQDERIMLLTLRSHDEDFEAWIKKQSFFIMNFGSFEIKQLLAIKGFPGYE